MDFGMSVDVFVDTIFVRARNLLNLQNYCFTMNFNVVPQQKP